MSQSRIHDIKPARSSKIPERKDSGRITPARQTRMRKHNNGGKGIWYVAGILLVALFFGLSVFFTGATVRVVPQTMDLPLNERFVANKKAVSTELTFDFMVVDGEVSRAVNSETKKEVQEVSRGRVRIYNETGTQAQNLAIDTRLEDSTGRVYKTVDKVTVPGQQNIEGTLEPGFVDIDIYAAEPGQEYNQDGEVELKLVGFREANSPKYDTIYAKTITSLEGGFIGERFVLSDEDESQTKETLTQELYDELFAQSLAQVPQGSMLPQNLSKLINTSYSQEVQDDGTINFVLKGSLFNVIFNTKEFEGYIIDTSVAGAEQGQIYIQNINNLNIAYLDEQAQTVDLESLETLGFKIDDVLKIVWVVNVDALRFDLVGTKKKDFQKVIAGYPSIETAELIVKPFWRGSLPESDEDIEVVNTQD